MTKRIRSVSSWDPVAHWYDGWMGKDGSHHHQRFAIPAVLELLNLQEGEHILDVGSGQGVFAPYAIQAGAHYVGIDASPRLVQLARQRHGQKARFIVGDVRTLSIHKHIRPASFNAAVFLLSIQDMNPLDAILNSVAWTLRRDGRLVLLLTHPCFRIPRQSGWEWHPERAIEYRRIDRYLTPLSIPMKQHPGQQGCTISFHRPLQDYMNGLAASGLYIDHFKEIVVDEHSEINDKQSKRRRAQHRARLEIPLFLGIRARKLAKQV